MSRKPRGWSSSEMTLSTSISSAKFKGCKTLEYMEDARRGAKLENKSGELFYQRKSKGCNKATWQISTNAVTKGCARLSVENLMYRGVPIRPRPVGGKYARY